MGRPKKYNSKQLTDHLRQLAAEAHDWSEDGAITKGEALARLLWQKALGSVEKQLDDEGKEKEIVHKPESWAIQLVYERMEGRTPQALDEDPHKVTAADRVRDLAKKRANSLAEEVAASAPVKKSPPSFKRKEKDE